MGKKEVEAWYLNLMYPKKIVLMSALQQYIVGAEVLAAKATAAGFKINNPADSGIVVAKNLLEQLEELK